MTPLRLVTLLCFIFLKQGFLLPALAAEAVMQCATGANNATCTCDEGGCDMSTCKTECDCKGGGCKMPNCGGDCKCAGGNCNMSTCSLDCRCAGGSCDISKCVAYCDCDKGGCDMPSCVTACDVGGSNGSSRVFKNVFLAFATIIPVGIMLW